jgi:hypothetical protein
MFMISEYGWQGTYIIKTKDSVEIINNRIMDGALTELLKALRGIATDLELAYLAVGTDGTAVTNSDTQLGAEIFRTPFTAAAVTGIGELTSEAIILEAEAVGTIEEIGIFAGTGATAAADSGLLVSRILWHRVKTASDEIQFTRIDKIGRG